MPSLFPRRFSPALRLALGAVICCLSGCFAPWFRGKAEGPEAIQTRRDTIRAKLEGPDRPLILREIASERLLTLSPLENVGLVTGLDRTGGSVVASQPREKLLAVMRREDVAEPNILLDSTATAMVVTHTTVPPAARKGQALDISIELSQHAVATDLQRGWLMPVSLMEMTNVGGTVREGFEYAVAEGPIVTRAQVLGSDLPEDRTRGVVIGGGRLLKQRELGIGVNADFADALTMAAVLPAINSRFTVFDGSQKVGIATPEKDSFISLATPPKYQWDPFHFVNVVLNISFNEGPEQRAARLTALTHQSQEPLSVRQACWELEALGESASPVLVANLNHPNQEVRFYNAHALAYLNDKRAIEPLKSLCRREPAFRAMCLNCLTIIDSYEAGEALEDLMHAADPETRYGALRAMRRRDARDPRVAGLKIPGVGTILEIPSDGPPLVAVSLQDVPEVAIFGSSPLLELPAFYYINPKMIIQPNEQQGATISRFEAGKDDAIIHTDRDLGSVLAGIAEAGGNYGDWVSLLRVFSQKGNLMEPLAMNPVPRAGRTYDRVKDSSDPSLANASPGDGSDQELVAAPESDESAASVEASSGTWYNPFTWFSSGS